MRCSSPFISKAISLHGVGPIHYSHAIVKVQFLHHCAQIRIITMNHIATLSALLLSETLLQAELTTTEVNKKGDWTIHSVTDEEGNYVRSEMVRVYDGKHEISLRLSFDDEHFWIDSSGDWSGLPDAESHAAEYRIDQNGGDPIWKGEASVIEDEDGKPWLRITQPNEPGAGDEFPEGKTLFITVGKAGSEVQWEFDLKGGGEAFEAMLDNIAAVAAAGDGGAAEENADSGLVEHEYARPGDWSVHYYTDKDGGFVQASMIRFYDGGQMLRLTMDDSQMHIDTTGDWEALEGAAKNKETGKISVTIASKESPGDNSLIYDGEVIDDEGDKWLRITQSFEEPGGLSDGISNAETLMLKFGNGKSWTFDLKGSNAAEKKLAECIEKHSN